jgi:hypothetical protein
VINKIGLDVNHCSFAIRLLAAHLYLRFLKIIPSLIRFWWTECKNRQWSMAVERYTERYFSPIIIEEEFQSLSKKDSSTFEGMVLKTIRGANEISAGYPVDDHYLEMVFKFPNTAPLRQVDVETGKSGHVGVTQARWRGWLLSTASVIVTQNGSVADALSLFKKNVSLHFDGIEDCAICYSIIGALDRSLPTKKCRTCKNLFHPGCLFKVRIKKLMW